MTEAVCSDCEEVLLEDEVDTCDDLGERPAARLCDYCRAERTVFNARLAAEARSARCAW